MAGGERTYRWDDPAALRDAVGGMSGRELIEAIIAGRLPAAPIYATLGFRIVEVGEGRGVVELDTGVHQANFSGIVHGGVIVAALDSAAGAAVNSVLPAGGAFTTLNLATTFLSPVRTDAGRVHAEAELLHSGRRTAVAEARLHGADGKLCAHATATCVILSG